MDNLIFYIAFGSVFILVLVIVVNMLVNMAIKQFTERALLQFQHRLAQEVAKSLEAFREGVCEQMANQERRTDSLASLYAALIDLLRDGKDFIAGIGKGDLLQAEKKLRSLEQTSRSFCEQYRKQSLHFSNNFKEIMDGFISELEAVNQFFNAQWKSGPKNILEKSANDEKVRQTWVKTEDRVVVVMDLMRNEFRKRVQPPESVMKKWLNEPASPGDPPVITPEP